MTKRKLTLDVRPDFRSGKHPCDKIQTALRGVGPGEILRLLIPFEPLLVFEFARNQGLRHEARQTLEGDWEVLFSRRSRTAQEPARPAVPQASSCGCGCSTPESMENVDVDARGLEPPQPTVRILEALSSLPEGVALSALTDRRPIHLYSMLEARGFLGESEEQGDGSFITHIRRA